MAGWLACWFVGWLAGLLACWLACWLAGLLGLELVVSKLGVADRRSLGCVDAVRCRMCESNGCQTKCLRQFGSSCCFIACTRNGEKKRQDWNSRADACITV